MAFFAGGDVTFHLQKGSSLCIAPGGLSKEMSIKQADPSNSEFWEGPGNGWGRQRVNVKK